MSTPEGRVKAMLKRALDKAFPLHYRLMPVQQGLGASTLDYLCCIGGLFIAFETKAPGKKMTPRQTIVAEEITEAGGRAFLIDGPVSIEHAIKCLSAAYRTWA
jgi:hypothetical protein